VKSQPIEWPGFSAGTGIDVDHTVSRLNTATRWIARASLALAAASAIVVVATWLARSPDLVIYLQAALWTSSFVFLGLAIDLQKPSNGLSLASGVVVPILTDLSSSIATEFAIVAAAIIAAWVAGAIWRG